MAQMRESISNKDLCYYYVHLRHNPGSRARICARFIDMAQMALSQHVHFKDCESARKCDWTFLSPNKHRSDYRHCCPAYAADGVNLLVKPVDTCDNPAPIGAPINFLWQVLIFSK
jgi:hypothetical protein